jgi:putative phosphoribosyl transferase
MIFRDRTEAGRRLAERLRHYAGRSDVLVLALPRGGVPVAAEVARELGAPLDVFIVRKLGFPGQEELAMGAIASGGSRVLNRSLLGRLHVSPEALERVASREMDELERRERVYRGGNAPLPVHGRTVILVDDGLATGATMRVAAAALRGKDPARIIVAVPVAAESSCQDFGDMVEEIVCVETPRSFGAVGQFYEDFSQTSDEEVRRLLEASRAGRAVARPRPPGRIEARNRQGLGA